jgi:hypothetical protein
MPASPAATSRIHESLDTALARKRVVLWYDPNGEWTSEFDDDQPPQAEKLRVEGNEFSLKVAISRASLDQRYLLYIPSEKPAEPDKTGCWICCWRAMSSRPIAPRSTFRKRGSR